MEFALDVLVGMVVMAIIDLPVINYVIKPTLEKTAKDYVAKKPDLLAAGIFYVGYVALVVYLSQQIGENAVEVGVASALLGLLAYGTYEFTNKAVLGKWSWPMVAVDTSWGVILTTFVGLVAYWV